MVASIFILICLFIGLILLAFVHEDLRRYNAARIDITSFIRQHLQFWESIMRLSILPFSDVSESTKNNLGATQ